MRIARPAAALAILSALAGAASAEPLDVRVRAIERFGSEDPGRLAFLGGVVVSGPRGFGGWSGLLVEGDRFLAASDVGRWMTGRLVLEEDRLTGLADLSWHVRRDAEGRPIAAKRKGDAEALAARPGEVLVAVEGARRLLAYPADGLDVDWQAPARTLPLAPPAVAAVRRRGLEALAQLPGGPLILITEGSGSTGHRAFRIPGRGFDIAADGDWSITGADVLPGGDLILLERRYGGGIDIAMRVRRIGRDALAGGGTAHGPVLMEATFASEIDNMEAVAASEEDGRIVLTLMSDDNLSFWQRTLVLRFAVSDPLPRTRPAQGS